jgi:hypothetical protein
MSEPEPRDTRPSKNADRRATGERHDHDASLPGVAIPGDREQGSADDLPDDGERVAGDDAVEPGPDYDNRTATEGGAK